MRKAYSYHPFQNELLVGILIGFALIILGRILVPTTNPLSIGGACLVLSIYALVGCFGPPKICTEILHWASFFGFIAGVIFTGEIVLEYIILSKDNTSWGLVEFGSVFFLYFLSGLWVSYQRDRIRSGILSASLSAMLSGLVWLIANLIMFYVFRGTARQAQVFTAEGNYTDFAKSGMADFNVFIMEDFLGAGFFHLLLGPILATILGTIGGLLGKGLVKHKKT
jgi:hypothetical protein